MSGKRWQAGLSLVELMIGTVVGMIVIGGVTSVYVSTIKGSSATLKSSRLNQDMGAIMSVMMNDIRRAGYWGGGTIGAATANPFSQPGSTALEVHALSGGVYANAGAQGSGSCIVYAYDLNHGGGVDTNEGFGFRWDGAGNAILTRTAHTVVNNCTNGTWESLTDTSSITITDLTFDLGNSQCLNLSEPNKEDEASGAAVAAAAEVFAERDCYNASYPADTGETVVEVRQVTITLSAALADDASVVGSLTQSVQVRNNLVREIP
ncbi:MAG: hypothetical protein OQL08_07545 [Gammaproteobacteria bacterium]|nr:hypothetical protein [Gammaproteobacteria bacterium]